MRMSAEERRESVIRAAMSEFARGGYLGTSTEAIAKRVGVSQPYLFKLFPNKRAMFLAAALRCIEESRDSFVRAAEGVPHEDVFVAMASSYMNRFDPERLMMQMQMQVAVFVAKEKGDEEFGEIIRRGWTDLWDTCRDLLGADDKGITDFMACGMLINTMVALDYPDDHRLWQQLKIT